MHHRPSGRDPPHSFRRENNPQRAYDRNADTHRALSGSPIVQNRCSVRVTKATPEHLCLPRPQIPCRNDWRYRDVNRPVPRERAGDTAHPTNGSD
jgi:hypothetical protein